MDLQNEGMRDVLYMHAWLVGLVPISEEVGALALEMVAKSQFQRWDSIRLNCI